MYISCSLNFSTLKQETNEQLMCFIIVFRPVIPTGSLLKQRVSNLCRCCLATRYFHVTTATMFRLLHRAPLLIKQINQPKCCPVCILSLCAKCLRKFNTCMWFLKRNKFLLLLLNDKLFSL